MENFKTEDIKKIRALIYKNGKQDNCVLEFEATYSDGEVKVYGLPFADPKDETAIAGRENILEGREETTKLFLECLKNSNLKSKDVEAYYTDSQKAIDEYDELTGAVIIEDNKKSNAKKVLAGVGLGVALTAAAAGIGHHFVDRHEEPVAVTAETDMDIDNEEVVEVEDTFVKPDMEGKDWNYYLENALNYDYSNVDQTNLEEIKGIRGLIDQKTFMQNIYAFVDYINEAAQPYFEGYTDGNGEQVVFNITPEEAFAMAARFNNLSNEEIVNIFGNTSIDVDNILNVDSNSFQKKMTAFYGMCPIESHVDALFINPNEAQTVREFEEANIAMLNAEGKEKEEAMNKLHDMYPSYFRYDTDGHADEASWGSTDYILTSMLQSNTIVSETLGYKGTVVLQKRGSSQQVDVKTGLFNDNFVAYYNNNYVHDDWDENFVDELGQGYKSDNWQLVDRTEGLSVASKSCALQSKRFESVADFSLRSEIEAAKSGNEKSTADYLSETSYAPQLILDMMKNELSMKYQFTSDSSDIYDAFLQKCVVEQDKLLGAAGNGKVTVKNIDTYNGMQFNSKQEADAFFNSQGIETIYTGEYSGPPMRDEVPNEIIHDDIASLQQAEAIKAANDKKTQEEAKERKEAEEHREEVKEEIIEKAIEDGVDPGSITTDPTGAVDANWFKDQEDDAPQAVIPPEALMQSNSTSSVNSPAPVVEPVQEAPTPEPVVEAPTPEPEPEIPGAVYFTDDQIEDMLNGGSAPEVEPAKTM